MLTIANPESYNYGNCDNLGLVTHCCRDSLEKLKTDLFDIAKGLIPC
jgi:hypothetical protein